MPTKEHNLMAVYRPTLSEPAACWFSATNLQEKHFKAQVL